MQSRINTSVLFMIAVTNLASITGCVNPPDRSSGVTPKTTEIPRDSGKLQPETPDTGGQRTVEDVGQGNTPRIVPPAPVSSSFKIKYWLNKTENNNCLTIQPVGAASISPKCVADGAVVSDWVTQDVAATTGPFKATIKIETTDKPLGNKFVSASDNVGEFGWRWRCVKTQDKVSKVIVHTVCYEDGNTLAKTFDSADLFVQFVGPESVELTGVQCTNGADIDMTKCAPK